MGSKYWDVTKPTLVNSPTKMGVEWIYYGDIIDIYIIIIYIYCNIQYYII